MKLVPSFKVCPVGRCPYDNPARRNLAIEDIIEGMANVLERKCANAGLGCQFEGIVTTLEDHEREECPHRLREFRQD